MSMNNKFSPEVREHAVRLVQEHRHYYPSLWATVRFIAPIIGCSASTLHNWIKRAEIDCGIRLGMSTAIDKRIKALMQENRELNRANEALKRERLYRISVKLDHPRGQWMLISISLEACIN